MGLKDSEVSLYKLKEMKDNKELFTDEDDMILFWTQKKTYRILSESPKEGAVSYARNTVRYVDAGQGFAFVEGAVSYACHTIRYVDVSQRKAILVSIIS